MFVSKSRHTILVGPVSTGGLFSQSVIAQVISDVVEMSTRYGFLAVCLPRGVDGVYVTLIPSLCMLFRPDKLPRTQLVRGSL